MSTVSYGEDKDYLRIRDLMKEKGVDLSSLYIGWAMAPTLRTGTLTKKTSFVMETST